MISERQKPTVHVLTKEELLEDLKSISGNTFCEQTIWISTHFPEYKKIDWRNHPYLLQDNGQHIKEQITTTVSAIIISTTLSKISHISDVDYNMENMLEVFTKEDMINKVKSETYETYKDMMGLDVSKELREKSHTETSVTYQIYIQLHNKCFHVDNWFEEGMVLNVK